MPKIDYSKIPNLPEVVYDTLTGEAVQRPTFKRRPDLGDFISEIFAALVMGIVVVLGAILLCVWLASLGHSPVLYLGMVAAVFIAFTAAYVFVAVERFTTHRSRKSQWDAYGSGLDEYVKKQGAILPSMPPSDEVTTGRVGGDFVKLHTSRRG